MTDVLLVDDEPLVRRGLRALLSDFDDLRVVGDAASGPAAVEAARRLRPDVVLMDVRMPGGDGIAAARTLAVDAGAPPMVLMTGPGQESDAIPALDAGATGFLLKNAEAEEVAAALRAATRGQGHISGAVARLVIDEFARRHPAEADPAATGLLTRRELSILRALCLGQTNAQIAAQLHLDPGTVKTHLSHILAKLGLQRRTQLVAWAFRHGCAS